MPKIEGWKGICSSGCYMAKTDKKKCKCKCHGEHHGKGRTNEQDLSTHQDGTRQAKLDF
ncbi:hypothetical protein MUO79_03245 [Candidatus Bathyarchaeota archaeon]|nr:hypothetical protein [Candidatus Bathyarchaeota archaeon]